MNASTNLGDYKCVYCKRGLFLFVCLWLWNTKIHTSPSAFDPKSNHWECIHTDRVDISVGANALKFELIPVTVYDAQDLCKSITKLPVRESTMWRWYRNQISRRDQILRMHSYIMSYRKDHNKIWIWYLNRDVRLYSEISKTNILVERFQKTMVIPR